MPTYEYECTSCKRRFDIYQSFKDEALTTCDECGGALRRVFHAVGVLFKGSGFYSTDSRSASSKSSGDSKGSSEGSATSDKKSDTGKPGKSDNSKTDSAPASGTAATKASEASSS